MSWSGESGSWTGAYTVPSVKVAASTALIADGEPPCDAGGLAAAPSCSCVKIIGAPPSGVGRSSLLSSCARKRLRPAAGG